MAAKIVKDSVKIALIRGYAAQAAAAPKQKSYSLPHHQPEVSKLTNGAVVAAYENNSPISRIAVFVKSGSRYETNDNSGVSQILRLCAGQKTQNFTAFGLTRHTQQFGGTLVCESGREYFSYEMSFLRNNFDEAFKMLSDVATHPNFRPWEIAEQKTRLLTELGARSPSVKVIDMLHAAAYRNSGLGNSLFIPEHRIGKVTTDELQKFFSDTHQSGRIAFVGLGVPHKQLAKLAQKVTVGSGTGIPLVPSTYSGGELRQETGCPLSYIAVACSGAKLGSEEATSLAIAQFILGGQPGTKYGSSASSKLSSIIAKAGGNGHAVALNANYTDGGLFGFLLVEEKEKAGDVLKALTKEIRSLKITDADVKNAKAKAKSAILMALESEDAELEELGLQSLITGNYISPSELAAAIDGVTAASVQSALSNATKGKVSMAAIGGLQNVPYADQL